MLKVTNISKTFNPGTINEKKALTDLSLHLEKGDFVTILGSNGAGKSTLFNAIAGSFPVDSGDIRLEGHIHPIQQNTAGIRNKAACNGIEQGGFARAVGTHNGSELAAFHMQIDIGQRFFLVHRTGVKSHTDMVQIKHGSCPLSG